IVPLFESRSDAESKSGTSHKTLAMTSLNSRFEGSGSPHDARSAPPGIAISNSLIDTNKSLKSETDLRHLSEVAQASLFTSGSSTVMTVGQRVNPRILQITVEMRWFPLRKPAKLSQSLN
ncbi:MAG: hypothetical protein NTZ35_00500, partial [Ignavibacteriales bacterium]|nr:hypothetical protein [Ignavibacteriales bacterium]